MASLTGQLSLSKTVENVTLGTPEGTSNLGQVGDVLLYRIYLENSSATPVGNVRVFDRTPPYTSLAEPIPDPVAVSHSLTCTLSTPAANAASYAGALEWTCSGILQPSESGPLAFRVAITP